MGGPTVVQLRTVLELVLAGSRLPQQAVLALIAGDDQGEDLLIEIARSRAVRDDAWAPVWALVTLGERRSPRALPAILDCIRTGSDLVHEAVEFALLRYGESAVDPILGFLDENPALEGRVHLYSVLAASRVRRAIDYLIGQLRLDEECAAPLAWALAETRDSLAMAAIERESQRLGAREPELSEALEAARGTDDLSNPLFQDWRAHWTFEEEDDADADADAEQEPDTLNDEEDGLNLQPRYFDVRCPVCESQIEYDSREDQTRVMKVPRKRPS